MRVESLPVYDRHFPLMFTESSSALAQNGKMALEGLHLEGYFQSLKSYILLRSLPCWLVFPDRAAAGADAEDDERDYALLAAKDKIVKCKGIQRLVRAAMTRKHFDLETIIADGGRSVLTAGWRLGATSGLQMVLGIHSRQMPTSINYKRYTFVSLPPQSRLFYDY